MPTIGSIVLASTHGAFHIAVVLEKHVVTKIDTTATSYICQIGPDMKAGVMEDDLEDLHSGYNYDTNGFLMKTPAYQWAEDFSRNLLKPEPIPPPTEPVAPAAPVALPASRLTHDDF